MKKHKLLREDILPAMASNRKVQRLLNEFMDLLSEYETADSTPEKKISSPEPPETVAPLPKDTTESTQPASDPTEAPPSTTQLGIDSSQLEATSIKTTTTTNRVNSSEPEKIDNQNPEPTEKYNRSSKPFR